MTSSAGVSPVRKLPHAGEDLAPSGVDGGQQVAGVPVLGGGPP